MVLRGIIALGLLLTVSTASADEFSVQHVTVYGTATLQVAPDQMRWSINVRNTNPKSAEAAKEHGAAVSSVLSLLKQNQVDEATIQTSRMQLGENWRYTQGSSVRDGYFASTDLTFILVDFDKYSSVWVGLAGLPTVTVRGIAMEHTERIRFQNEARAEAVRAARGKAEAVAEALGLRLGEALAVEEDLSVSEGRAYGPVTTNVTTTVGQPAVTEEYIAPGSIPIRARVKAVFRLLMPE